MGVAERQPRNHLRPASIPNFGATVDSVTINGNMIRAAVVLVVALTLAGLFYQFAGDIRMSLFVFLVTAFAGSLFAMISIVTREN